MGTLPKHNFITHTNSDSNYASLPHAGNEHALQYLLEVYIYNYITLVISTCKAHLDHVATVIMTGIHDLFTASSNNAINPIPSKKLNQLEARWVVTKDVIDFTFNGENKTL